LSDRPIHGKQRCAAEPKPRKTDVSDDLVEIETRGAVAVLRLNDAKTLNALSLDMADRLVVMLDEVARSHRAVVLTGAGKGFCSGANLSNRGTDDGEHDPGVALAQHLNPLMLKLRGLAVPLVTAVNGAAAGIGASLALAGDLVIASEQAYFLEAFCNIGLVPDGGSAFLLTRAAGRVRAMEMMLLGERVPAATALEWGLVNRVLAPEALLDTALDLATKLAAGPTMALAMIRKMCWDSLETGFEAQLAGECELQRAASRTADHREGVRAFQEKRPPIFTGA
jgi:2-(1,2-epoxy-1,2-dihydrophenyl)acetyl-CoA isomerase